MKLYIPILILLFFISCTNKSKQQIFAPQNLQVQLFTIDITKDTIIKTTGGAVITIPKGTLVGENSKVQIELKEAYTLQEMILAGLSTVANKKILSSGGMFYINAISNTNVKIAKPIGVKIPTQNVNDSMKLFSGVEKEGKLDWEKPMPFKEKNLDVNEIGKALFAANCASCHAIGYDALGPALANITRKRTRKWLYKFTRNWKDAVASGDFWSCYIQNYSTASMNLFTQLTDESLKYLYDYIEYADGDTKKPFIDDGVKAKQDSCEKYQNSIAKITELRNIKIDISTIQSKELQTELNYYDVEINNFGWHNIDVLVETMSGVVKSTIDIIISGEQKSNLKVYLVVPSQKILVFTNYQNGKFKFEYENEDGTMPLPNGEKAFIIASGEVDKKFYYTKQEFTISTNSKVTLQLQQASVYELNADMRRMGWDGLDIKAKSIENSIIEANKTPTQRQSKQLELIKYEIDKIKNLQPAEGCDCISSRI